MKKMKLCAVFSALVIAFAFTGCDSDTSTPGPAPAHTPALTADDVSWPEPLEEEFDPDEHYLAQEDMVPFRLSPEQERLFVEFSRSLDLEVFRDASPIDVAQVWVQNGLIGNIEAEFTMVYPASVTMTMEEYVYEAQQAGIVPLNRRAYFAYAFFGAMADGTFVYEGEDSGYIEYETAIEQLVGFYLQRNEDGIWMVWGLNPLVPLD